MTTENLCIDYEGVFNRFLKFVTLDDGRKYIFKGNDGSLIACKTNKIYHTLFEAYDVIQRSKEKRSVIPDIGICPDVYEDLFFTQDVPPYITNQLEDKDFFYKNQKKYSGFYIFPSYQCNLRCQYCTYSGIYKKERMHANVSIQPSMYSDILRFILESSAESQFVQIVFYGDEPLINMHFIQNLVESLEKAELDKKCPHPVFQVITNGLLLSDEIINFLIQHDIRLQISIDGPEEIHDRYRLTRNGASTHAHVLEKLKLIRYINETYFIQKVAVSCTIAPPFRMDEIDRYFQNDNEGLFSHLSGHKGNFSVSIMNKQGADFYQPDDLYVFREQVSVFRKLFYDYLLHGGSRAKFIPSAMFEAQFYQFVLRTIHSNTSDKWEYAGECLPGVGGAAIGADGKLFVCNTMNLKPIGTIYHGVNQHKVATLRKKHLRLRNGKCLNCWYYRYCPICIAAYKYAGNKYFENAYDCSSVLAKGEDLLKMYIQLTEEAPDQLKSFINNHV